MSSVPLPEAAQLQKPQDYKETFKVSLCAYLRMEIVLTTSPETHSRFRVCGSMQTGRVGIFQVSRAVSLVFETPTSRLTLGNSNDYDRDACLDYFRAYRECKAAWVAKHGTIMQSVILRMRFQIKQRREDRRSRRP